LRRPLWHYLCRSLRRSTRHLHTMSQLHKRSPNTGCRTDLMFLIKLWREIVAWNKYSLLQNNMKQPRWLPSILKETSLLHTQMVEWFLWGIRVGQRAIHTGQRGICAIQWGGTCGICTNQRGICVGQRDNRIMKSQFKNSVNYNIKI
jgi:hypothetical protein